MYILFKMNANLQFLYVLKLLTLSNRVWNYFLLASIELDIFVSKDAQHKTEIVLPVYHIFSLQCVWPRFPQFAVMLNIRECISQSLLGWTIFQYSLIVSMRKILRSLLMLRYMKNAGLCCQVAHKLDWYYMRFLGKLVLYIFLRSDMEAQEMIGSV